LAPEWPGTWGGKGGPQGGRVFPTQEEPRKGKKIKNAEKTPEG